jgi:uncharacterized Zn finger protein
VSVAEKRRNAQRELAKLKKQGRSVAPVTIEGRTIARSFWGKSWCSNLERYRDFAYRLPRGRSYVRNGAVLDLQVTKGRVDALVAGSEVYKINVTIAPVASARWQGICRDCAGTVESLIELLQGRFEKGVMNRVSREGDGLFPSPGEIKLSCSCPDWADMCKHVAAALYGVGARLDDEPQLLFVLRGVNENELLCDASRGVRLSRQTPNAAALLDEGDVAALFGLEMVEPASAEPATIVVSKPPRQTKTLNDGKAHNGKKASAARKRKPSRVPSLKPLKKASRRGAVTKTRGSN